MVGTKQVQFKVDMCADAIAIPTNEFCKHSMGAMGGAIKSGGNLCGGWYQKCVAQMSSDTILECVALPERCLT